MKLIFDEMLKSLASWARILGIDSSFLAGKGDDELLRIAGREGRTLITRDLQLTIRCDKQGIKFILIKSDRIEEQLAQLIRETGAGQELPEPTRCASCNGVLEEAPKESVADKISSTTLEHNERFWRCHGCGRVFWQGGHWKNIRRIHEKARALAKS